MTVNFWLINRQQQADNSFLWDPHTKHINTLCVCVCAKREIFATLNAVVHKVTIGSQLLNTTPQFSFTYTSRHWRHFLK